MGGRRPISVAVTDPCGPAREDRAGHDHTSSRPGRPGRRRRARGPGHRRRRRGRRRARHRRRTSLDHLDHPPGDGGEHPVHGDLPVVGAHRGDPRRCRRVRADGSRVARTLLDPEQESRRSRIPEPRRRRSRASPAFPVLCPQDHIEPLLVDEIRRRGGEVRFDAGVVDLRIDPRGVTARHWRTGAIVRARYVVGADGPRSTVRTARRHRARRARCARRVGAGAVPRRPGRAARRPPDVLWSITHPDAAGVLLPVGGGRWCYARQWWPDHGEQPADHTPARWTELIRTATGIPDLEPELLGRADVHDGGGGRVPDAPRARVPRRGRRAPDDAGRRRRDEHGAARRSRARLAPGLGGPRLGGRRAAGRVRRRARAGRAPPRGALVAGRGAGPRWTGWPATWAGPTGRR